MTALESSKDTALSLLAALQQIDRLQRERNLKLRAVETDLDRLKAEIEQQRGQTLARQSERDGLETKRRDLEALLEDEENKLKDRRMRLNRVRNEKELQALRREIEVTKETNQRNEEELLRLMEALEVASQATVESERLLAELQAGIEVRLAEGQAQMTELSASVDRERDERARIASALDGSLLRKYEQIFDRRGGMAVVDVRAGICQGCHINLPPQLYNELQRCADIRLCPNCHRILVWRAERVENGGPAE